MAAEDFGNQTESTYATTSSNSSHQTWNLVMRYYRWEKTPSSVEKCTT